METFSWSSPSSLSFTLIFTYVCLFSMIHNSKAQTTTDKNEVTVLGTILKKWEIVDNGNHCSDEAIKKNVTIEKADSPFFRCDCSYNNGTICHITGIKVIDDGIREIPEELKNLPELSYLNLSKNYLTGSLPAFIGNFTKMQYLSFRINSLSGLIPKDLGNLRNLIILDLGLNNFSGPLPDLGNLVKLQRLYIDSAGLSGKIPSNLGYLKDMEVLWASDNSFSGKFPDFMGNWTKMTELRLQGNSLQGPIPSSFSRLISFKDLRIGELSNATSSLEFISNMTSLKILILRNCMITASFPSFIEDFQNLEHLDLSFNNLKGSIPKTLFNSSSLLYLFLGNNNLNGTLSSINSTKLQVIDLSYNFFDGTIPSWANGTSITLQMNNFDNSTTDYLKSSPNNGLYCIQRSFPCSSRSLNYSGFAINSGGPNRSSFEADDKQFGAAVFYVADSKSWAVSSIGKFVDSDKSTYRQNDTDQVPNPSVDQGVVQSARVSPGSIRYYGLDLENGNYTIELHFVAFENSDAGNWESLWRRVFDIYIQGVLKEKDFDIKKAGGDRSFVDISKYYNQTQVTKNFLEIHLFWAGKGTCCVPSQDKYGPSIAAVKVQRESKTLPNDTLNQKTNGRNFGVIVGIPLAVGSMILLALVMTFILRRKMSLHSDQDIQGLTFRTHTFSYAELKTATNGFDPKNKIGEGGFGPVYKGILSDGRDIAVKQLSLRSHQGKIQFVTEIDTISAVQHRNLVKLYGCCIEGFHKLLVYEYLQNNSLDQALFGENDLDLSWKIRFEICIGVARGLAYLHEQCRPKIVHRDVKASNILLDTELNPKISDFGLAKLCDDKRSHISTKIAGTYGYMAPEYAMKGHLTEKADVFAFGVLLLEILSGKSNQVSNLNSKQTYLLEWAWFLHEDSRQLEIIDPRLREYNHEEAIKVFTVGLLCTQLSPSLRPTMSRVVSMLIGDVELTALPSQAGYWTDFNMRDLEGFSSSLSTTQSATTMYPSENDSKELLMTPTIHR